MRNCVFQCLVHLGIGVLISLWLKDRVPTKVQWAACRDDGSIGPTNESHWLEPWLARGVAKDTLCVGSFVWISKQHVVQTLVTSLLQKPLQSQVLKKQK